MTPTLQRVLSLLNLLESRPVWSGPELAAELGVTVRSIRRDVERLRDLGYPVRSTQGVGGGYQLASGKALPPLLLDDGEAVAVAVSLRLAAGGTVTGLGEAALRALTKLDQVLPQRLRGEVDAVGSSTSTVPQGGPEVSADLLLVLARAVRARERVGFGYTRPGGEPEPRRAEPYRLVASGSRWYLVVFDLDRDDWRTFRLDRISAPVSLGVRFAPREGPDPVALVRRSVTQAPYEHVARFRVHAPAAEVAAQVPVNAGEVTPETATTCIVAAGGNALDGVSFHVLRLGLEFEVLEPDWLAEQLREMAERLARAAVSR